MSRIVVALGGNALQADGTGSVEAQKAAAAQTATQLAELIKAGHELVITHGNGPQVGAILLSQEKTDGAAPLDTCVAMTQGEIGYWLQQALANELHTQGITKTTATIVTQTVVDAHDPAFQDPSKPVGTFYPSKEAALAALDGRKAVVKEDAGRGWRRVVASPMPKDIVEAAFIKQAVQSGVVVIAAGGGGIPVTNQDGRLTGIEAVIDKDFCAERLAELVEADTLLILTTVDTVSVNYRKPNQQELGHVTVKQMQDYADEGQFAPGSMLPKIQAAISFATSAEGRVCVVTSPGKAIDAINGKTGTRITKV